jgi:hypothetical protein
MVLKESLTPKIKTFILGVFPIVNPCQSSSNYNGRIGSGVKNKKCNQMINNNSKILMFKKF